MTRRHRRRWIALVLLIGTIVGLRTEVVDSVAVASASMSPTLCPGDQLLVLRLGADGSGPGDLVRFTDPEDGAPTVKRVVAVEGQVVDVLDAVLHVDGVPVDEPYVDVETVDGSYYGPYTVEPGEVFVLGDEREGSIDSRHYGGIPRDAIDGRVVLRLWSGCRNDG